jgi:hypothetical protein
MKKSNCNEAYEGKDAQSGEVCLLWWFHEGYHNSGHHKWYSQVPTQPPVVLSNAPE